MSYRFAILIPTFAAITGFVVPPLASASSFDGQAILGFLDAAEGQFSGRGQVVTENGAQQTTLGYEFNLAISADPYKEGTFDFDSQVNGDDGSIRGAHDRMRVQGDRLYYVDSGITAIPVRILSATATELDFSMSVVSNLNGQVYDILVAYTLNGDTFSGHYTTTTNGNIVGDETFSGTR